jgi:putative transposase
MRVPSVRTEENARLLKRMRQLHAEPDGVIGSPRLWEELRHAGERSEEVAC